MNRDDELRRLSQANQLVAEAESAVMKRIADFENESDHGHDAVAAERSLRAFTQSLQVLQDHRKLIALTIHQIDRGVIRSEA